MINNYEELYKGVGSENQIGLENMIYKSTSYGVSCTKIEGKGVLIGSIIEGLNHKLLFPFELDTFWDKIQEVEDEDCIIYNEQQKEWKYSFNDILQDKERWETGMLVVLFFIFPRIKKKYNKTA